jgi:hypothetical protein
VKKPERPKQSKHMGHMYRIKYVKELKEGEDILCGQTDNDKAIIQIEEGMPASKERETLLHEVLHQLLEISGFPEDIEEQICTYGGAALGAHIDANPLFWRYVTRRLPKDNSAAS